MIEVQGLTKYYGTFPALQDVSFSIGQGQVVGLLGLNGAGKTTCLRILTGYLVPGAGECRVGNRDVFGDPYEARALIGYLPEHPPLYPEMTVQDFLHFVARLRGEMVPDFESEFLRVTRLTQLEPARRSLIRHLSLGYRKRVGIAQALIGSPPVLIFDEPISGLDPVQIVEVRKLIRELAGKHTILISSHILTEVSRTCDRVLVIHKGRMAGEIAGEDLTQNLESRFMEMTASPVVEVGR
ncbi:MAG: ABC transporter ATP-binding protein [Spirochaetales bacterium]|nr:ABC transporter ATP-binding protein [Leptospiraceae bacterium]MCP5479867.1 ABC transporter ATP-binding protein [Spirochaetales bacterium]MCP5486257.1 ABC transporter ATP-binding protein [Spirochaetales bacterium]